MIHRRCTAVHRNTVRSKVIKWFVVACIAGVTILYLFLTGPGIRMVHFAASYSDNARLHTVNRFTEAKFVYAINPHHYNLVIAEENKCEQKDAYVFLLVLIHSKPSHIDLRKKQRMTSLRETNVRGKRIIVVYLVGNTTNKNLNDRIFNESHVYRDIIMEDFLDTYYNLTNKFMMGMKWASLYCPQAKYVLKGDDDVYFNLHNIVQMLSSAPSVNFISGYVHNYAKPYRNEGSKWYIPESVYPYKYYPPFCVGYAYVMSGDLPRKLFQVAQHIPFFPLDDVFMGFCARKLNVLPVYKVGFRRPGWGRLSFCNLNLSYAIHFSDYQQIPKMWSEQQSNLDDKTCSKVMYYLRSLF
ncbi:beta-1,3-galactosyltransferase 1-like [Apostichopus japonicus]|uniref:beta-1,3-galactosyltransferase 1-like n=1 Tax=Stichopus japonicus TaxID=307972 RepID=UPI003AB7F244